MSELVTPVTPAEPAPVTAPHDEGPPQNLLDFMVTQWKPRGPVPPAIEGAERFAARRDILSGHFKGQALVIPTGREKVRANDTNYAFRPGTDFYYLTGNVEADCVLVFEPRGDGHVTTLYVEPNEGKTDKTFFMDRAKGELWVGPRLGVAESSARFGIEARGLPELETRIADLRARFEGNLRVLRDIDPEFERAFGESTEADRELAATLSEMRLLKDDYEIAQLQRAIDATQRGFEDVLRGLPAFKTERYVEGTFNLRARVEGNDVGYHTIAAAGAHACTLHWNANDGPLRSDELLLLDAGVETLTLYTADVTRTIPIGGTFTPEQREIYTLVYQAQQAAFEKCAPGEGFLAPNAAAMAVLARGLERLGILANADEALAEENLFYKRYSLHNISHMLGIDVHDCAKARAENYKYGKLEAGMVLTIEPGLYFQPDDLTVPERYRGIGVRIEDDIVITKSGYTNLSGAIPSEPGAVESWVRGLAGKPREL
jgi:Xaa-Pro aminopeptidase